MYIIILFVALALATPLSAINPLSRIIGGQETTISQVPSQASIHNNGRYLCGGSIIGERTILTAGHCANGYPASQLSVRVGSDYHSQGGSLRAVIGAKIHPRYIASTLNFDVALLYLTISLSFSSTVARIPVASSVLRVNNQGTVSGWGAVTEGGDAVSKLRSVTISVISRSYCKNAYSRKLTETMYCAGRLSGGKDSCQGDSGGPLIIKGKIAGVVSWGDGCGVRNHPGVYTWVSKLRTWINSNTI